MGDRRYSKAFRATRRSGRELTAVLGALLCALLLSAVACSSTEISSTYFNSDDSWPPTVLNNPRKITPHIFYVNAWNKCRSELTARQHPRDLARAPDYTGVTTSNVEAFACSERDFNDLDPPSFIQLDHSEKQVGIWLTSTGMAGSPFSAYNLTAATPVIELGPKMPWLQEEGKVSVSFKMRIVRWQGNLDSNVVVPYIVAWLILEHPNSRKRMWYGVTVFDPRACSEWVSYDEGSRLPMVESCLSETSTYVRLGKGSNLTQHDASTDEMYFSFEIRKKDLRRGVAAFNEWARANQVPEWKPGNNSLSRYKVVGISLVGEVADADDARVTSLELSPGSIDQTVGVDIWILRDPKVGWQQTRSFDMGGTLIDNPVVVDMTDVKEFQGHITAIAFSPRVSEISGPLGLNSFILRDNYNRVVANLALEAMPNPLPPLFSSGHVFSPDSLWWFSDSLRTGGTFSTGAVSSDVQQSLPVMSSGPVLLEDSGNLGFWVGSIQVSGDVL